MKVASWLRKLVLLAALVGLPAAAFGWSSWNAREVNAFMGPKHDDDLTSRAAMSALDALLNAQAAGQGNGPWSVRYGADALVVNGAVRTEARGFDEPRGSVLFDFPANPATPPVLRARVRQASCDRILLSGHPLFVRNAEVSFLMSPDAAATEWMRVDPAWRYESVPCRGVPGTGATLLIRLRPA